MHWDRNGLGAFHHDVMAAMYSIQFPASRFELGDNGFAVHVEKSRPEKIYLQGTAANVAPKLVADWGGVRARARLHYRG